NFWQRTVPIYTIGSQTHVLVRFFPFGCILDRFATARNLVQNAPNWCNYCKTSCNDVLLKIFTTNAPDPHHWTLNSFFGAFLSVWVHLEPFRNCTKLGAKWANLVQLMQEFMPQSLIIISRNGRSRSTQLDPKLMFSCVSFFLGAFGTIMLLLHKLDAKHSKLVQLMQKFVPRCLIRNFRNERSRSTPLDPKLMFWCLSFRSGAFWTVSLFHETWCKMGQPGAIKAKVCAIKSHPNFSTQTLPIHIIGSSAHVFKHFFPF